MSPWIGFLISKRSGNVDAVKLMNRIDTKSVIEANRTRNEFLNLIK